MISTYTLEKIAEIRGKSEIAATLAEYSVAIMQYIIGSWNTIDVYITIGIVMIIAVVALELTKRHMNNIYTYSDKYNLSWWALTVAEGSVGTLIVLLLFAMAINAGVTIEPQN
ncbi:MAG: hypothetical protein GY853_14485 [PVC group bacterium]|nr:hypothetical protein [PVC group bacterium]